jgi:mannose-1-phosphate guanylyltransferase/mannose-6-phosphate isomerase
MSPPSPIAPVLLCGGVGTRLWPASRRGRPKQFGRLLGATSLFQAAAARLPVPGFAPPLVVTGEPFRFLVAEELAEIGLTPALVLLEPEGRNTGPAAFAAARLAAAADPGALLLVCPCDHAIPDGAAFRAAVRRAEPAARAGAIVAFGARPDRPETGYGWLGFADPPAPDAPAPLPVADFVEKPPAAAAAAFLAGGRHLWNMGVYLATAATLAAAFAARAPGLAAAVDRALAAAAPDLGFLRLDAGAWAEVPAVSIDHAVIEGVARDGTGADGTAGLRALPFDAAWSDLGSWEAVVREMGTDARGVARAGTVEAIDCEDCLLRAESPDQVLVGIGLRDTVAVAMADAVLVADRRAGPEGLRRAVAALEARGAAQAREAPRAHRPWGWYEVLARGPRYQVKRLVVRPGGRLSLQSHVHRAEHWVVVAGAARVTLGAEARLLGENESVYVPAGAVHRLENPGKLELELIEVQSGGYLGEDDITRHEDAYARR